MYRIMIVDDEPIVLDSLKSFSWEDCNCQVVFWAESGTSALEQISLFQPDILISDIRMPGLNGLELSQKIKNIYPDIEIILLTGYAEFEYAKQAMSIGIRQYLLKPFRFEDITAALKLCIKSLEEKNIIQSRYHIMQEKLKTISPMLTTQIYQDLLDGKMGNYSEKLDILNIQPSTYVVISTQSDSPGGPLDLVLYAQLTELLDGMEPEIHLAQGIDIISCILCFQSTHPYSFCEQASLHLCEMLQTAVMEKLGLSISFGISLPSQDPFMLHQQKKQSVQALNFRQTLGNSSLMLFSDMQNNNDHGVFNLTMYEKKIQKCIVQSHAEELKTVCQSMLKELLKSAHGDFSYIRKTLINLVVLTYRFAETYGASKGGEYDSIEKLFQHESIEKLSENAFSLLLALLSPEPVSFGNGVAEKVTDYIEQNLNQNISLELLSQNSNYSTAYLSRLIKKTTGQSFSELLSELRLNKACQMLKSTDDKVSDIAEKTGYHDVSYFISVFKKKTGVTPKEWRSLAKLGEL